MAIKWSDKMSLRMHDEDGQNTLFLNALGHGVAVSDTLVAPSRPQGLNIEAIRAATPGAAHCIHLNGAGAGLMSQAVLKTIVDHLHREAHDGCYEAAETVAHERDDVYTSAAKLMGCDPDEVAFLDSASRAWAMFFVSLDWEEGDVVISTEAEYASNFMCMLQAQKKLAIEIAIVPPGTDGLPDPDKLSDLLIKHGHRVRMVSLTHAATNNGAIAPVQTLSGIVQDARRKGRIHQDAAIVVDACQTLGQIDLSVDKLGCDVLTATSRKFLRGPRGIGLLYVRRDRSSKCAPLEPRILDVRSAVWTHKNAYAVYTPAQRFETWDKCVATKLGLGKAIDEILAIGMPTIERRISMLGGHMRCALGDIPGVRIVDTGQRYGGTVTFTVDGRTPEELITWLQKRKINIGLADKELVRLDAERRSLGAVARCSTHIYNTKDEVSEFADALRHCVRMA